MSENSDEIIGNEFMLLKKIKNTRRVAVYLQTHCNIGSKRAFLTGVLDWCRNCLLIYYEIWQSAFVIIAEL